MDASIFAMVERVTSKFDCASAGPATQGEVDRAQEKLGCTFPPSYRSFLETVGNLTLPDNLGVVQSFVGLGVEFPQATGALPFRDVVTATTIAREKHGLNPHLIVVAVGANPHEWFCLDTRESTDGEYPVRLFDSKDNALDGQFYPSFREMLGEVLGAAEVRSQQSMN